MRPRGEVREALAVAVARLAAARGPVSCREVAAHAQVGFETARLTLLNMVRAGQVQVAGKEKPAGSTFWHNLYEPPADEEAPLAWGGIETLDSAMRAFVKPSE
jgi:hypothetical protein